MQEWISVEKKRDGLKCLEVFFQYLHGMEVREVKYSPIRWRRMRDVWIREGKEDEEGRRVFILLERRR